MRWETRPVIWPALAAESRIAKSASTAKSKRRGEIKRVPCAKADKEETPKLLSNSVNATESTKFDNTICTHSLVSDYKTGKRTDKVAMDRAVSLQLRTSTASCWNDMDLHGKLPPVLLPFKQTNVADPQTVATCKFGPASTEKPPSTIAVPTRHHLGFP
jgi:hypothetical protein